LLRENNFLVGLSVDASQRIHNRNRLTAAGEGTYDTCMAKKELLEKNNVEYNILCVLTNDLANEPDKVWNFIKNENIRFIQFIPCLDPLPSENEGPVKSSGYALRLIPFAKFYSRLLHYWIPEFESGNYISIKFFDDVVNYFLRGIPTVCGMNGQCHNQYIVEADGSVYPCDFFASDSYKIGNLATSTPREMFDTEKVREFINDKPELPAICGTCGFFNECRGGCKRMRNVMYAGAGGTMCGFRMFLEKGLGPLEEAVRKVIK
ncbi:MAG: SPASM domain-containing protein, partial [Treponema sp.]|nr:SPASM domain-containing protein [Treponema sp.]